MGTVESKRSWIVTVLPASVALNFVLSAASSAAQSPPCCPWPPHARSERCRPNPDPALTRSEGVAFLLGRYLEFRVKFHDVAFAAALARFQNCAPSVLGPTSNTPESFVHPALSFPGPTPSIAFSLPFLVLLALQKSGSPGRCSEHRTSLAFRFLPSMPPSPFSLIPLPPVVHSRFRCRFRCRFRYWRHPGLRSDRAIDPPAAINACRRRCGASFPLTAAGAVVADAFHACACCPPLLLLVASAVPSYSSAGSNALASAFSNGTW